MTESNIDPFSILSSSDLKVVLYTSVFSEVTYSNTKTEIKLNQEPGKKTFSRILVNFLSWFNMLSHE